MSTPYRKHPYNDCCIPDCYLAAEWLPVVLLYDPELGKKSRPAQVTIKSFPLCNRHKGMGRIGLGHLMSDKAWTQLADKIEKMGATRPQKKFTGIGFIRKDEATTAAEAQFLDLRKLT